MTSNCKDPKKKLLFVMHDLCGGGAERVAITLMNELVRRNYKVTLFLIYHHGDYWDELSPKINVIVAIKEKRSLLLSMPLLLLKLSRIAAGYDLLIASLEGPATVIAQVVGASMKKPVIAWVHTTMMEYAPSRFSKLLTVISRHAYRHVAAVVCVTKAAENSFHTWMGSHCLQITHVIYNPLKIVTYEHAESIHTASVWRLLGVGRLELQKGFDILINAHAQLRSEGVNCQLTICGEGKDRQLLESLVLNLGVRDTVDMPGFRSDIDTVYGLSDIFVLSSHFEGAGMVLLEAMSHKLPVVASDCPGGPRELLCDGKYGVLVPSQDVDALVSGIKSLIYDKKKYIELSKLGIKRAAQFNPEIITQQWEELIPIVVGNYYSKKVTV